ncbi:hypothetical protein [Salinispora mooreana]|uniref:hypothetical protein n=1 Tax=Salinispora mooreana TaxID=999545 RepID=UPI00037C25EE|nr:hypothetical protein [Salinispora mooreana]
MCSTGTLLIGTHPEVFDSAMNYPSHPHPHRRPAMPLVARAAHAATAAYQRAWTGKRERLYQQENQRLREEVRRLRNEIRHCANVIEVMGHDLESRRREFFLGELLAQADARRRTVVVDQRRLLEVHLREQLAAEAEETVRATYAEGYADGIMRPRTDGQN